MMKGKQNNTNNQQLFDFNEIINYLTNKINNEVYTKEKSKKRKEKNIKINIVLSKFFGNEDVFALITILILIIGLFSLGVFFLIKSYEIFHALSLVKDARELSSTLMFISSATSSCLGFGCLFNFANILEALSSFYKTFIIEPIGNALENSREKNYRRIKLKQKKINELDKILKKLTNMKDDFKYMVNSSLKDKLFTKQDVEFLYKHLNSYNIVALIHLLYHNGEKEINLLSFEEQIKLNNELERRIDTVKRYARDIEERQKNENTNHRHKRMERFHAYPYDEKLNEEFSECIPTTVKRKN